eukprot:scpid72417/ scgid32127/ 
MMTWNVSPGQRTNLCALALGTATTLCLILSYAHVAADHQYTSRNSLPEAAPHSISAAVVDPVPRSTTQPPVFDICIRNTSSATDNRYCTPMKVLQLFECLTYKLFTFLTWRCTRSGELLKGHNAAICTVLGALFARYATLERVFCKSSQFSYTNILKSLQEISQNVISVCPAIGLPILYQGVHDISGIPLNWSSCFNLDSTRVSRFMARSTLGLARTIYMMVSLTQQPPLACWDRDLLAAEHISGLQVRWDVDDACIDFLQVAIRSAVHRTWKFCMRSLFHGDLLNFIAQWLSLRNASLRIFVKSLFEILRRLDLVHSDNFLQRFLYPPLKRFRMRAQDSQQYPNYPTDGEHTSPSCRGLRGKEAEIQQTTMRLTQLMLVNELHYYEHSPIAQLLISQANQYLMLFWLMCPL